MGERIKQGAAQAWFVVVYTAPLWIPVAALAAGVTAAVVLFKKK